MAQVLKPEVRARIQHAALEVFAEHGYRDAAMADIARRAGVATASIYRYHPSKQALFESVLSDQLIAEHDRLLDARVAALAQPERPEQPAEDLLAFWLGHRLAVATLLDHADPTSRSFYAATFVDRLITHVEGALPHPLTAMQRELLALVFHNTRRAVATILRSSDDTAELRAKIAGFWSYQLPGLDGLLDWIRTTATTAT